MSRNREINIIETIKQQDINDNIIYDNYNIVYDDYKIINDYNIIKNNDYKIIYNNIVHDIGIIIDNIINVEIHPEVHPEGLNIILSGVLHSPEIGR